MTLNFWKLLAWKQRLRPEYVDGQWSPKTTTFKSPIKFRLPVPHRQILYYAHRSLSGSPWPLEVLERWSPWFGQQKVRKKGLKYFIYKKRVFYLFGFRLKKEAPARFGLANKFTRHIRYFLSASASDALLVTLFFIHFSTISQNRLVNRFVFNRKIFFW